MDNKLATDVLPYVSSTKWVLCLVFCLLLADCYVGAQCATVGIKAESTPIGLDAASASITPTSLHDDFVNMMKAQGLEKMATEIGILRNGALVDTPHAATLTPRKAGSEQKHASETPTFASPSFTSPCVSTYFVLRARVLFLPGAGVVVGHRGRIDDI